MDFSDIAATVRLYNFHSHTQFCDGRAAMEDFAKMAVSCGFTHYGFSPHSPVPIFSKCNMSKEDIPAYLAEVDRLKGLYGDKVRFYASMEIDYLGKEWGPSHGYFSSLPLDYKIGAIHFIQSDEGYIDIDGRFENFKERMARYFHNDIRHVVETFYKESMAMLDAGGFDMIAHFDKIGHNASLFKDGIEDEPWYQQLVNDLIDLIIAKKVVVELNTKAWDQHRRMFPNKRFLGRLVQAKVPIVVNSDAHLPELINAGREMGFVMLDSLAKQNNA